MTHLVGRGSKTGVGNTLSLAGHIGSKIIYGGQCKHHMDLIKMTFKRKWAFSIPFSEKKHFKRHFQSSINLKICSRATLRCLAGRMWPTGRTLPRPGLKD